MQAFQVTRRLLSFGPQYDVVGEDGRHVVVRGRVLSFTPKLTMTAGEGGHELCTIEGNLLKTRYGCKLDGRPVAALGFKMISFEKTFTLTIGGRECRAEGDVPAFDFKLSDEHGGPLMAVRKQWSLRDRFQVYVADGMPWQVAVMAAVAVDQKYVSEDAEAVAV
jgi:uncharacterized protein YxjI